MASTRATTPISYDLCEQLQSLVQLYGLKSVQDALQKIAFPSTFTANPGEIDDRPKKQDETTKATEQLNQSILDASFEAILVADQSSGSILKVNASMLKIFGFESQEEVVGQNLSRFIVDGEVDGMDTHNYMQKFCDRAATSTILGVQRHLMARKANGVEFPCRIGLRNVLDSQHLVAFIHDITHEKAAEREFHLCQSILDSSFESIVVADDDGKIIKVNASMLAIFRFEREEDVVGQNLSLLVGGEKGHAEKHSQYLKKFWERGGTSSILGAQRKLIARRRDGTQFPCRIGVRKVLDSELLVGFIHDITTEQEADHERQLNQSILDSSFESIIVTNDNGDIIKVNASMLSTFGFENSDDILGKNISMLVGGEGKHAENHSSYMQKFRARGGKSAVLGTQRRLIARRVNGTEFPCRIGVRKVPNSDLLVGFIHDATHEERSLELAVEKRAAEELLYNMLPQEIAMRLKSDPGHLADHFHEATILFGDIVGFTKMSNSLPPVEIVRFLNVIFSLFDEKLDKYGLNKVKTIGDCYMVTSIPTCRHPPKSCSAVCHFAMDMIHVLDEYNKKHPERPLNMRIGINIGPVVAGVVGTKRFLYDIWGDAVNLASRMESTGQPGRVQVTQAVVDVVSAANDDFTFEKRGVVHVKGIGDMETYFIEERDKNRSWSYWKTLRSSIAADDSRESQDIIELLQNVKQLETSPSSDEVSGSLGRGRGVLERVEESIGDVA
ncbi:hypothetical protein ACA910_001675 [Epithemia clementina (nom. ined.)]